MAAVWALDEMKDADFGDERLNKRAAVTLAALGSRPNLSIPAACRGHAETQAAYRFFDNEKVTFRKVLEPHVQRTQERMAAQDLVLLVQDTSEIDLSRPTRPVAGVGKLAGTRRGVLLHDQHAFTGDGIALGTVDAQVINREEVEPDQPGGREPDVSYRERCRRTPLEQKESMRWVSGLRRARQVAAALPGTRFICLADSEADLYECFAEPRRETADSPAVDWIVRSCHDRVLAEPDAEHPAEPDAGQAQLHRHVREAVLATKVLEKTTLKVRARVARNKNEKRRRQRSRSARTAKVQVRAATVTLRPPQRTGVKLPEVTVNVVLVSEPKPPAGEPAVEWVLITTLPVKTLEQVRAVIAHYRVRWNIELLFRTLKSGCRIEQRRLEAVDRVLPCLALYLIAAWRTQFVCRLGRKLPEADCGAVFEEAEWKSVWCATQNRKPPKKPPTLKKMVRLVASLGGFVDGPGREPGVQTIWIGLQRMRDLAWAWAAFGPDAR